MATQRPSLIQRFQALFRPREQSQQAATLVVPPPRPSALLTVFNAEMGRRAVAEQCRLMYDEDPRAQGVIDTLARDTVKGGFELQIAPSARSGAAMAAEARRVATALLDRVGFWELGEEWVRETLNDGDTFLELVANDDGDIVEVSRKPSLEIHRWTDEFDRFVDPGRAFFWTDLVWNGFEPPANAVFFAEWQLIHMRGGKRSNSRYGRPLLGSARRAYKRMNEGELDIAIRRKTRAGMKYVHALEDASEADIQAYRVRNKAALDDPFNAVADFFSNKRTAITAIQGDARLSEIDDVLHHIRTWWVASPVPMSLLGYGHDLNRDVLDEQVKQYDAVKEQMSNWVFGQLVKPLVERQWLLKGIYPPGLSWSVQWSAKKAMTATALREAGDAALKLKALGLRDETILRLLSLFIPDFDAEAEIKALAAQMRDEVARVGVLAADGANTMDRMDAVGQGDTVKG